MLEWLLIVHSIIPIVYVNSLKWLKRSGIRKCENRGRVSVVIPMRNDCEHLIPKLKDLCNTSTSKLIDLEIIIVDNSDDERCIEECYRVVGQLKCPYSLVCHRSALKGKIRAMNLGWRIASGEYVLFTDIDTYGVTPEVISESLNRLCEDIGLVSPPINAHYRSGLVKFLEGNYYENTFRLYLEESEVYSTPIFAGPFMLIRKTDLKRLGGIYEKVGADDSYLAQRVVLELRKRAIYFPHKGVVENIDEDSIMFLKKKVRRAQHLQQAFLSSLPKVVKSRNVPFSYKYIFLSRFYLTIPNPLVGLVGFLSLLNSNSILAVLLTLIAITIPTTRAWLTSQVTLLLGLASNLVARRRNSLVWK